MTVYRCAECGHTVEVCTPNAEVVHPCKAGARPSLRKLVTTEAPAHSR